MTDVRKFAFAAFVAIVIMVSGSIACVSLEQSRQLARENDALRMGLDSRDAEAYSAIWQVYGEKRADEFSNYALMRNN